jgi:hypothetical protein
LAGNKVVSLVNHADRPEFVRDGPRFHPWNDDRSLALMPDEIKKLESAMRNNNNNKMSE